MPMINLPGTLSALSSCFLSSSAWHTINEMIVDTTLQIDIMYSDNHLARSEVIQSTNIKKAKDTKDFELLESEHIISSVKARSASAQQRMNELKYLRQILEYLKESMNEPRSNTNPMLCSLYEDLLQKVYSLAIEGPNAENLLALHGSVLSPKLGRLLESIHNHPIEIKPTPTETIRVFLMREGKSELFWMIPELSYMETDWRDKLCTIMTSPKTMQDYLKISATLKPKYIE